MKVTILGIQGEIEKMGILFFSRKIFVWFDNEVTPKIQKCKKKQQQ